MMSHDPRRLCPFTPDANDRLPVRTPADLAEAIAALAAALGGAVTTETTASGLVAQAACQFAKAVEQTHVTPVDKTTLLVHLVAARLPERGAGSPHADRSRGGSIAWVHVLAGASPASFC